MRKTTSLKVDPVLWKKVKLKFIESDIEISDYIKNLIKSDLSDN